jgi:hypothetical protein
MPWLCRFNDVVKVLLACKHVDAAVIGYGYLPPLFGSHRLSKAPALTSLPTATTTASSVLMSAATTLQPAAGASAKAMPSVPCLAGLCKVASSAADAILAKADLLPAGAAAVAPLHAAVVAAASSASAGSGIVAGLARDALAACAGGQLSGRSGGREGSEAVLRMPDSCLTGCSGPAPVSADLVACMPLHLAAGLGNVDILRMLLEHYGAEHLHTPPRLDPDMSMLSMFVLQAPLHHAVQAGSLECVALLLEHGHAVDGQTAHLSRTPLHLAALLGRVNIVQLLLEHGVCSACLAVAAFANLVDFLLDALDCLY